VAEIIHDWNGRPITIVRSRRGVKAAIDVYDNVIRTGIRPWPPSELVQKTYASEAIRAFSTEDLNSLTACLGHYSDLQSIHSEDALTWAVFGPIVYATRTTQVDFAEQLCEALGLNVANDGDAHWWLWRRIPHPDKPVSGGPEVDVGLHFGDLVIFGEAKWGSGVGSGQGVGRQKDQITLRREWCQGLGARLFPPEQRFIVLGISRTGNMLSMRKGECANSNVGYRDITWDALAALAAHPLSNELQQYLAWKAEHTRETLGERRSREARASTARIERFGSA
jgi:hypothetical protein